MTRKPRRYTLTFDPMALERCFAAADILADAATQDCEYALLGLSRRDEPFHVIRTIFLPGQYVSPASVYQPGYNVIGTRAEIDRLSASDRSRLLPICFIHRHPDSCAASGTDEEFLKGTFVDQVSTVFTFRRARAVKPLGHECPKREASKWDFGMKRTSAPCLAAEYSVAFSLIVNHLREHAIYAVRRERCPRCGQRIVRTVPAELRIASGSRLSASETARLRRVLRAEIRSRLHLASAATEGGFV
jgi:hypothetical protein